MDGNKTITVIFELVYTLDISIITGQGSVYREPNEDSYEPGAEVQLLADASQGWMFDGWGEDATGDDNPTTITMDGNKTVTAEFIEDADSDGVPSEEEQGPDGTDTDYSGNDDEIPDSEQPNVVSGHTFDDAYYLTLASPTGTTIVNAVVEDLPGNAPQDYEFPYGLISFAIDNVVPGGTSTMEIYLPEGQTCETYYKYKDGAWEEFLYDGDTGAEINGNVITLHFVDGGRGDQDGIEGIITDPGALAVAIEPVSAEESLSSYLLEDDDKNKWYRCFISSTGIGSNTSPVIEVFMLLLLAFAALPALKSMKTK